MTLAKQLAADAHFDALEAEGYAARKADPLAANPYSGSLDARAWQCGAERRGRDLPLTAEEQAVLAR